MCGYLFLEILLICALSVLHSYEGVSLKRIKRQDEQITEGNVADFTGVTTPIRASTTTPMTTQVTTPNQCFYEGRYLYPGEYAGYSRSGDFCGGVYCEYDQPLLHFDFFTNEGCDQFELEHGLRTTSTPSSPPTTIPNQCFYEGRYLHPGEYAEYTRSASFCNGMYCDGENSGYLIAFDYFTNAACDKFELEHGLRTTTTRITISSVSTTHQEGACDYRGMLYPPGYIIEDNECTRIWCDNLGSGQVIVNVADPGGYPCGANSIKPHMIRLLVIQLTLYLLNIISKRIILL